MRKTKKPKILIFVVAYNQEKIIKHLLERIPKEVINGVSEILVADDASRDNTAKIALEYKKQHNLKKLKVVRHEINKGYGGNQKWAYDYAIKNNFDIAIMLHGDAQYPPEHIPNLLFPLKERKADFVFGSRMTGAPRKGGMPLYKFLGNKFLTTTENIILKPKPWLSEYHSGFRLYSVKALKDIPFHKNSDDYHFDSEIIIQLMIAKKKITEKPIPTHYGDEKCNVNVIKYGFSILGLLGQYLLHKSCLRYYEKFDVKNHNKI